MFITQRLCATVTLPGFAPFRRTGVLLGTAETVRVAVEMSVSQVGETVDVTAEAPLLQTDRTSVSGAIGAEMPPTSRHW